MLSATKIGNNENTACYMSNAMDTPSAKPVFGFEFSVVSEVLRSERRRFKLTKN